MIEVSTTDHFLLTFCSIFIAIGAADLWVDHKMSMADVN